MKNENEAAIDALRRYGRHEDRCSKWEWVNAGFDDIVQRKVLGAGPCDCGLFSAMNTTSEDGNQPPSGLRGDPVVRRTTDDDTRDKSLQPHDLAPLTPTQGREEKKALTCYGCGLLHIPLERRRDPTPADHADPRFDVIWDVVKHVDVEWEGGLRSGATGNDVCAILDALSAVPAQVEELLPLRDRMTSIINAAFDAIDSNLRMLKTRYGDIQTIHREQARDKVAERRSEVLRLADAAILDWASSLSGSSQSQPEGKVKS